jgi:hypothetical protein
MKTNEEAAKINVYHESPFCGKFESRYRYILLPYGYMVNVPLKGARYGDILVFNNGDGAEIYSVCSVKLKTKLASVLAIMRYGKPLKRIMEMWEMKSVIDGGTKDAVDKDVCLLVYHGDKKVKV